MRRHLKSMVLAGAVALTAMTSVIAGGGVARAATIGACANTPDDGNCNGAQVHIGDACWDSAYVVTAAGTAWYSDQNYSFKTELWYSRLCKSNFAVTTVTGTGLGYYDVSNKIRRGGNQHDPYLMLHAGYITMYPWSTGAMVISPLIFSPQNPAQACLSTRANDQAVCTAYA